MRKIITVLSASTLALGMSTALGASNDGANSIKYNCLCQDAPNCQIQKINGLTPKITLTLQYTKSKTERLLEQLVVTVNNKPYTFKMIGGYSFTPNNYPVRTATYQFPVTSSHCTGQTCSGTSDAVQVYPELNLSSPKREVAIYVSGIGTGGQNSITQHFFCNNTFNSS